MTLKIKVIVSGTLLALATAGIITATPKRKHHQFDATATYKSKCVSCHGAKAEKKFDPAKSDDELVQVILKGKKAEKPPNMPGYETKGIDAAQAKELLDHMRTLGQ